MAQTHGRERRWRSPVLQICSNPNGQTGRRRQNYRYFHLIITVACLLCSLIPDPASQQERPRFLEREVGCVQLVHLNIALNR